MPSRRTSEIADTALTRLRGASRNAFRNVSCEYDEGTITLRGHSTSYYDKQLAQETVRGVEGVTRIVNEIVVMPDSISTATRTAPTLPIRVALRGLELGIPDFEFVLTGARVLVGSCESADLLIDDPCVSGYHCELGSINGALWVRDLGSTHGVLVNGFRETQSHLMPGDRLTIGETSFRVEYEHHLPRSYEDALA
jgi:hypothetical protein